TCLPGTDLTACGTGGIACGTCSSVTNNNCSTGSCRCGTGSTCGSGLQCLTNGMCGCGSKVCSGCCKGTVCYPGTGIRFCGRGGRLCSDCCSGVPLQFCCSICAPATMSCL